MGARPLGLQAAMPTLPSPPRFIDNSVVPRHRRAGVLVFQITQHKLVEYPTTPEGVVNKQGGRVGKNIQAGDLFLERGSILSNNSLPAGKRLSSSGSDTK